MIHIKSHKYKFGYLEPCGKLMVVKMLLVVAMCLLAHALAFSAPGLRSGDRQTTQRHSDLISMKNYGLSAGYLASKGMGQKGTSSETDSTINLTKNMLGAGVFSLSAKVAMVGGNTGIVSPVSALIAGMAAWATYNFYTLSEVCRITNAPNYPEAWARTISPKTKFITAFVIVMAPIIASLSNTIVLTEVLAMLMNSIGVPAAISGNRNVVIALLSGLVFYPLCIKQNLGNLKKASVFGIAGHLTAIGVMAKRAFDGSYAAGGAYYAGSAMQIAAKAASTKAGAKAASAAAPAAASSLSSLFLVASMVSYCIVSHYNTPKYYNELDKKNRVFAVAAKAHLATAAIYISSIFVGLKLFGKHSKSFALASLSTSDPLAILANAAFGCSVLASQPLVFLVMRNTFVESLLPSALPAFKQHFTTKNVTVGLLTLIAAVASRVTDVAVVGTVAGSLLGSAMMFVFPPLLYIKALKKEALREGTQADKVKIAFNVMLLVAGLGFWSYSSTNAIKKFISVM
jgi:sodium-coupled neutral amino acid transporter 11